MALTVTVNTRHRFNNARLNTLLFQADTSYPAGGYTFTANSLGVDKIDALILNPVSGYIPVYNFLTGKLQFFWVDTTVDGFPMVEVTAATNLSTVYAGGIVIGK